MDTYLVQNVDARNLERRNQLLQTADGLEGVGDRLLESCSGLQDASETVGQDPKLADTIRLLHAAHTDLTDVMGRVRRAEARVRCRVRDLDALS